MSGDRAGLLRRLTEVEPDRPAPYPWLEGSDRTVADSVAWVNAELMKNVAEIGQPRMLRHATGTGPASGPTRHPGGRYGP